MNMSGYIFSLICSSSWHAQVKDLITNCHENEISNKTTLFHTFQEYEVWRCCFFCNIQVMTAALYVLWNLSPLYCRLKTFSKEVSHIFSFKILMSNCTGVITEYTARQHSWITPFSGAIHWFYLHGYQNLLLQHNGLSSCANLQLVYWAGNWVTEPFTYSYEEANLSRK